MGRRLSSIREQDEAKGSLPSPNSHRFFLKNCVEKDSVKKKSCSFPPHHLCPQVPSRSILPGPSFSIEHGIGGENGECHIRSACCPSWQSCHHPGLSEAHSPLALPAWVFFQNVSNKHDLRFFFIIIIIIIIIVIFHTRIKHRQCCRRVGRG